MSSTANVTELRSRPAGDGVNAALQSVTEGLGSRGGVGWGGGLRGSALWSLALSHSCFYCPFGFGTCTAETSQPAGIHFRPGFTACLQSPRLLPMPAFLQEAAAANLNYHLNGVPEHTLNFIPVSEKIMNMRQSVARTVFTKTIVLVNCNFQPFPWVFIEPPYSCTLGMPG